MGLIPRRHRSLVYKVLITVPLIWLTVAFVMYNSNHNREAAEAVEALPLVEANNNNVLELKRTEARKRTFENDNADNVEPDDVNGHHDEGVAPKPPDPNGPGEMGKPVKIENPDPAVKKLIDDGWQKNAFNQYVSDMISVDRSLPDPRDEWCKADGRFTKRKLPTTSVVICFHNEAWSVLLRTVHSVMDRSPRHLLKEIILVDDASDMREYYII